MGDQELRSEWSEGRRIVGGIRFYGALVIATCAVLQILFLAQSGTDVLVAGAAAAGGLAGTLYVFQGRLFVAAPVSTLMVAAFNLCSISGALLVKTVEWMPVSDRLDAPLQTFLLLAGTQLVLIATHYIYCSSVQIQRLRAALTDRVVEPMRLLDWPSDQSLWIMGAVGFFSAFIIGGDFDNAQFGLAVAWKKILHTVEFLKYAPFLIPFRAALSSVGIDFRGRYWPLVGYFFALVVLSFVTNSRSTFADAFPVIGSVTLFSIAVGRVQTLRLSRQTVAIWAVLAAIMTVGLSRLALAMIVVRSQRGGDALELVGLTFDALLDSAWLDIVRRELQAEHLIRSYSEVYVDSIFMSRFLATKYHDIIVSGTERLLPTDLALLAEVIRDKIVLTLPEPLLKLLGVGFDKRDFLWSNGDYVFYLLEGWGLGGYRTGSMIPELWAVTGWWSVPILASVTLLLFLAHDMMAARRGAGRLVISPLLLLMTWTVCGTTGSYGLSSESIHVPLSALFRGLPQAMILFALAALCLRFLARLNGRPMLDQNFKPRS